MSRPQHSPLAGVRTVDSTTITISSSQNPSLTGQSVTFTATLVCTPNHGAFDPGGTVEFFDGATSLGTGVVNADVVGDNTGTATITTSALTSGSHNITADFLPPGGGTGPGGFNPNDTSNTFAQSVGDTATWDGSNGSDWHMAANWTTNFVPLATHGVILPTGALPNNPLISSSNVTVTTFVMSTNRLLFINNGRTLTVTTSMAMNGGDVDSLGAGQTGTLVIDDGATLTRTSGAIQTAVSLRKEFTAGARSTEAPQATFVFPVGTSTGYSPLTANVTAGSNGTLTAKVTNGTIAPLADGTTLDRYWTLTETGDLTADLTFQYLNADVDGNEANYRLIRSNGTNATAFPNVCPGGPCVTPAADTIVANGTTSFDNHWTAGEPAAPTAANVEVAGRVLTQDGRGVARAIVTMTGQDGNVRYAMTNPFGYYRFDSVPSGQDYVVAVASKQYRFMARLIALTDGIGNLDFIAELE